MQRNAGFARMSVRGVELEYRHLSGDGDKRTLVLLHEGLGCVELWRDFPEKLVAETGCSVFVYSRAGYGGSDPIVLPRPLNYMTVEAEEVLPHVIAKAAIVDYTLVGHSDGATIALAYAAHVNDPKLRSVVLFSPHVFTERCAIESITKVRDAYRESNLRDRLMKYHGANVDCAFRGWCDSWLDPRFIEWSIEAELERVSIPVLQIQGRNDEYGTSEQLQRITQGVKSDVRTVLYDDCGHSPHQQQCQQSLKTIAEFIQHHC